MTRKPFPTASSLRQSLADQLTNELALFAQSVESPTEELMLWAMLLGWQANGAMPGEAWWSCDLFTTEDFPGAGAGSDGRGGHCLVGFEIGSMNSQRIQIVLQPQIQVGERRYRLDFAVLVERFVRKAPPGAGTGKVIQDSSWYERYDAVYINVECDGHDFHERTKEQAARDKRRDRDLQSVGWVVARFTGSEIFKDAPAAAAQVRDIVSARQNASRG